MKIVGITSTALLSLLLGVAVPAYAQHDEQSEKQDQSEPHQGKHEQGRPEEQQHGQPPQHTRREQRREQNEQAHQSQQQDRNMEKPHARQQQRTEQSNRRQDRTNQQRGRDTQQLHDQHQQAQQQRRNNQSPQRSQEQQRIQQSAWQQHRSRHWDSDHRTWRQRGGYHGYRIPEYRFRGYFGPSHGFRISSLPFLVVGGYPRFQYEGYWFSPVDPWPEYWGNDWYDNDEVYVNYVDNGYYLYNSRHPDVAIAISISM